MSADAGQTKVLLVEDTRGPAFVDRTLLTHAGFVVTRVDSGARALRVLEADLPHIILCDVLLTDMDGLEFCRRIRSSERGCVRDVPIILATTTDHSEHMVEGLAAGANDCVAKPLSEPILLARMNTHLHLDNVRRELAHRNAELSTRNAEMEANLAQALRVHENLLPARIPETDELAVAVRYLPHDKIGGDIYNLLRTHGDRYLVFIGDVSGHGISAALFSAAVQLVFKRAQVDNQSPAAILQEMNLAMSQGATGQFFLTAICALLDPHEQTVVWANAGHPSAILRRAGRGDSVLLESQAMPLNVDHDTTFVESEVRFEPGDFIVFYTDGVTECLNDAGQQYGQESLAKVTEAIGIPNDAEDAAQMILDDVVRFVGDPPTAHDDMSVIVVHRKE